MIISRTPYRISFFGGGSDFPEHFLECGGRVISMAINKYCYINVRKLPPFFTHRDRIVWSQVENVSRYSEIKHPAVRAVLQYINLPFGVSVIHDGDIPARSGIGSSSAFTVGLLNALHMLNGEKMGKRELAEQAIVIEREHLKETVGCQDQICSAYGGFNTIEFFEDQSFRVHPLDLENDRLNEFRKYFFLVYSGVSRISSEVAQEQNRSIFKNRANLIDLTNMAKEAEDLLYSNRDIKDFGRMLHEAWMIKRTLSSKISSDFIDEIYRKAITAGALGGKLLGAGAGGFLFFFVPPAKQSAVRNALQNFMRIPFDIDVTGSTIVYNDHGEI